MRKFNRRQTLKAGIAVLSAATLVRPRPARAAPEFNLKISTTLPTGHSFVTRMNEVAKNLAQETNGRVALEMFPGGVLGNEVELSSQVRSGALDFIMMNSGLFVSLAPATAVTAIGFAFKNYEQVWAAADNELGDVVRASLGKAGVHAFKNAWDLGFHQLTSSKGPIRTPDDFAGLKIRAPNVPIYISFFQGVGAAPVAVPFPETYSALQAKIVDAQGQSLSTLYAAKLYEVQKYLSLTRHIWNDTFVMANPRIFSGLPSGIQETITKHFNAAALLQRKDSAAGEGPILADLKAKGIIINEPDQEVFRERLKKSDYYPSWKKRVGDEAWDKLEKYVGKLT